MRNCKKIVYIFLINIILTQTSLLPFFKKTENAIIKEYKNCQRNIKKRNKVDWIAYYNKIKNSEKSVLCKIKLTASVIYIWCKSHPTFSLGAITGLFGVSFYAGCKLGEYELNHKKKAKSIRPIISYLGTPFFAGQKLGKYMLSPKFIGNLSLLCCIYLCIYNFNGEHL